MEKIYEKSEWELINPKNIHFSLNNHDGLIWELLVGTKTEDGYCRGMPIGSIVEGDSENNIKFVSNQKDEEYSYRIIMSGVKILFFRRKRK